MSDSRVARLAALLRRIRADIDGIRRQDPLLATWAALVLTARIQDIDLALTETAPVCQCVTPIAGAHEPDCEARGVQYAPREPEQFFCAATGSTLLCANFEHTGIRCAPPGCRSFPLNAGEMPSGARVATAESSRSDAASGLQPSGASPPREPDPPSLREFFYRCWDYARGLGGELDGADIQEWGEKLGLLQKVVASAPCGEGCVCAEYVGDDFPTDCYRPTFERVGVQYAPRDEPTGGRPIEPQSTISGVGEPVGKTAGEAESALLFGAAQSNELPGGGFSGGSAGTMSATVWGTNLYEGEPTGDLASTIDCGRYTKIYEMRFRDGVNIIAAPPIPAGDVFVGNCMFEARVRYTPNVRFENCYFCGGKPEVWVDLMAPGKAE